MEKLTITRIGEPKKVDFIDKRTGHPKSFMKVGFLTSEHGGERWFDFTFDENHSLKVGETYEFEIIPREYNGKTYYTAKFPKKNGGSGSEVLHEINVLKTTLGKHSFILEALYDHLLQGQKLREKKEAEDDALFAKHDAERGW